MKVREPTLVVIRWLEAKLRYSTCE